MPREPDPMTMIRPQGELRQRIEPYRKLKYRQFVASKPCMACGRGDPRDSGAFTQCAHIRSGFYGMSEKPDDWFTIPLCAESVSGCHAKFAKNERKFARHVLRMTIPELKARAKRDWAAWAARNGGNHE